MELDIRLPIGLMFSSLGPLLCITGLLQQTSLNTSTGAAMTVFGVFMLLMGLRSHRAQKSAASSAAPPTAAE